jgi:probable rRNA maturation factor
LGDVIIAEETLAREAGEQGIATADHFRHLAVHGLLHLLGYDHEIETEANAMEMLETRILGSIGVRDPYAGTEPIDDPPSPASATGR